MTQERKPGHVTIGSIIIRCYEYERMAAFWQEALHYVVSHADPKGGFVILSDLRGRGHERVDRPSMERIELVGTDWLTRAEKLRVLAPLPPRHTSCCCFRP